MQKRSIQLSKKRGGERKRERESRGNHSPGIFHFQREFMTIPAASRRRSLHSLSLSLSFSPPFTGRIGSSLQRGLPVWYRSTVEAHELFSRLCPWENTRVAPVGIVNAAANCARRRRPPLARLLNIAFFFRHRYRHRFPRIGQPPPPSSSSLDSPLSINRQIFQPRHLRVTGRFDWPRGYLGGGGRNSPPPPPPRLSNSSSSNVVVIAVCSADSSGSYVAAGRRALQLFPA